MAWDDNANVCGAPSLVVEASLSSDVHAEDPNLLPERIALRPTWPGMTMPMSAELRLELSRQCLSLKVRSR